MVMEKYIIKIKLKRKEKRKSMDFELIKRKIMLGGFYVIRRVTRPFLEEDIEHMRDILLLALNKQMSML